MTHRPEPDTKAEATDPGRPTVKKLDLRTVGLTVLLAAFTPWAGVLARFLVDDPTGANLATRIATFAVCVAVLVLALPCVVSAGHLLRASPLLWALCALAGFSSLWSEDPALSLRRSLLLGLSVLLAHVLHRARSVDGVIRLLALALSGLVVLSVGAALLIPELGDSRLGWRGIVGHKNHLGFLAALLGTALAVLALWGARSQQWVAGLALAGTLLVLGPIHSITAIIALSLGLLVVIAGRLSDQRMSWRATALALPLLPAIAIGAAPEAVFSLFQRSPSLTNRTGIWADLLTVLLERPLLGYGFGMDWHRVPALAESALVLRGPWLVGAHNGILQVGFWLGAVGTILLLVLLVVVVLRAGARFLDGSPGPERVFPLAILAVLLTTAGVEDVLLKADVGWVVFCFLAIDLRPSATVHQPRGQGRHLVFFLPRLDGGGAERVALLLAKWWSENGTRVDLVVLQREGALVTAIHDRVGVIELRANRVRWAIPELVGVLRRLQPDTMLSCLDHANVAAVLAHGVAGSRARLVLMQVSPLTGPGTPRTSLSARLVRGAMRATYPLADAVLAPSRHTGDELVHALGLPPLLVHRVPNPVDAQDLEALAREPAGFEWLDQEDVPVVLAAGRLVNVKAFDVLIDALAVLRPGIEVRAIVLGEGEERAALQARINEADLADRVVLPGFVANPFAAMARADVFVLSSRQETFGNVLVEAMSLGVPVIATRCPGGPGEILEDGRWGTLVPEEDAEALAQAILDVLRTGGIDARARARDFRLESVAPRYQAVVFPFTGEAD